MIRCSPARRKRTSSSFLLAKEKASRINWPSAQGVIIPQSRSQRNTNTEIWNPSALTPPPPYAPSSTAPMVTTSDQSIVSTTASFSSPAGRASPQPFHGPHTWQRKWRSHTPLARMTAASETSDLSGSYDRRSNSRGSGKSLMLQFPWLRHQAGVLSLMSMSQGAATLPPLPLHPHRQ